MDKAIKESIDNLSSKDDVIRMQALERVLAATDQKVDWVYEVWDGLLEQLDSENSYQCVIAIRVLSNLAKSDPEDRLNASLDRILAHTKDEKFITSRLCLQSIWKIATANRKYRDIILQHYELRYAECIDENHYNLLRQDIVQSMILIYEAEKDDGLLTKIKTLVSEEKETKYRKKYESLLKGL